ncbi:MULTISPECIES: nucleotide sugar dehydrogenase [unclassified Streptomyces]|uniref:nucleotide sugar dehydrogenase n=1 Tax=unclassified Streptomyces TaxID=2593676 RepID=UPI00093A5456|nr:nucleotide sugar dehydrogenase [Streptomyces sp. CB02058]OKI94018.1 GDP-mannose dehydrogenase [Streptomyces sp. CB02058]
MNSRTSYADYDVCVVGLGYVGITLTSALLARGKRVLGYEANKAVAEDLAAGLVQLSEPGVEEMVREHAGGNLRVTAELTGEQLPPTVIICVGTPIAAGEQRPDLTQLEAAVAGIAPGLRDDTLVIVRSTVPVGTSRGLVLPTLRRHVDEPLLAFCPERTIQGQALAEILSLPQIVGGLDEESVRRASELFGSLTPDLVPVSSLETAEMIKLICNCHTDLIYGFGNEVALVAEHLGLDAMELINSANTGYPRPDLSKPGFVGGSCLTKDPYLLMHALEGHDHRPTMVAAARSLNESMPRRVGERVLAKLWEGGCDPAGARVLLTGFAYKGRPETDDLRGAPFEALLELLRGRVGEIVGHDFVVPDSRLEELGVRPVSLEEGFTGAHAALVLNDHLSYGQQDFTSLIARMHQPAVVYDTWRVIPSSLPNVMRLGHA